MKKIVWLPLLALLATTASAEGTLGKVSTNFRFVGPNDKIAINYFNDTDVKGVTCYISHAETGGISGAVGVAEDSDIAAINCVQTGPIELSDKIKSGKANGTKVFKKRSSLVFKTLQVVRFYDEDNQSLIYLAYSDRVIEGYPQNSISAVAVRPWPESNAK